jgi:DNA replication protein DnaC
MTLDGVPANHCARCGGGGYVLYASGTASRARACECQSPCHACGGAGVRERRDDKGYRFWAACGCQSLDRRVAAYNRASIPAKFFDRDLLNYEPTSERQAAAQVAAGKFARAFRAGMAGFLLMGPVGTGKTHLVCAVLAQLTIESGVSCRFVDFFHLLHELRDGFSSQRPMGDLLGPLEEVPVLAIDELGKGKNTEWELGVLDELISNRYNQQKTTLFTTNYTDDPSTTYSLAFGDARTASSAKTPRAAATDRRVLRETLEDRLGPRIYSRLREMCTFRYVDGPDWRSLHAAPATV